MKTALKITGLLFGFLLFLSIEIKDKPIFAHIYGVISPATQYAQNTTEDFFSRSVNKTETYSKKLFDNSVPKVKDSVKSKLAAQKKILIEEPAERITEQEKKELDALIKNH
ncbi:hypothetical protein [Peredibacter starrii]|uniref:Uncharacterized protein n=1 Tax=Peredibacter starrii TaxID=28202 RepID=A0AAX4HQX6_9BACT|nr:hypothetical protein [Peredibacter starrii]WPU65600.1 hypothetical protein SOO65_02450 [Peredibacter starrii]